MTVNKQHAAVAALGAAVVGVLPRMRAEFDRDGALGKPTAAAMWSLYGLGSCGLVAAGMGAFVGPAQVTGTQAGPLTTGGVYRISRNPQYAGSVAAGLGAVLARRSPTAAALAAAYGAVCAWWIPVEERALAREFGQEYETFRRSTARWLGRLRPCHDRRDSCGTAVRC
jgi:protein-S-isoprenylcysteine O-methyltransferase Ste14